MFFKYMNQVAEAKITSEDVNLILNDVLNEESNLLDKNDNNKNFQTVETNEIFEKIQLNEKSEETKEEILIKTFLIIFESYLSKDNKELEKFNIKLTPDINKYFLILCKESPELFSVIEDSFKKIILDNNINLKDIPEILVLVSKVYKVINDKKGFVNTDPYELIKELLHLALIVYIEQNQIKNNQLWIDLFKIIETSLDLIKLTPINKSNFNCFKEFMCFV